MGTAKRRKTTSHNPNPFPDTWDDIAERGFPPDNTPEYIGQYRIPVMYRGKIHSIPVDANGFVLKEDLIRRFYQIQGTNRSPEKDKAVDAEVMIDYHEGMRPLDVIEWWVNPASMDIRGIDDRIHIFTNSRGATRKSTKKYHEQFILRGFDKNDEERFHRTVDSAFTADELKAIFNKGTIVVTVVEDIEGNAMGAFYPYDNSIIYESESLYEPVFIHELVHALKYHDDNPRGVVTRSQFRVIDGLPPRIREKEQARLIDLEESETMLETVSRMNPYVQPHTSSYYNYVASDKVDALAKMREDRKRITGIARYTIGIRGKPLMESIESKYDKTHISRLSFESKTSTAVGTAYKYGWRAPRKQRRK